MNISVIVCTHNPRKEYFSRVIDSLKSQTINLSCWELLVVDNASDRLVKEDFDFSWHPNSRHIREEQLGLTAARLRGIRESKSDLLVFVDDDNVLSKNYLETAFELSQKWPILGVWGGRIVPEFETSPPEWTKLYWGNLAIRLFDKDQWGNSPYLLESLPCGAGLCLIRSVAEKYADLVTHSKRQMLLGRKGASLASAEDTVIALTACEMGYGIGLFTSLELVHIMPSTRLEESYLLRLEEGLSYSGHILDSIQGIVRETTWKSKVYRFLKFLLTTPRERRFQLAASRGAKLAKEALYSI